MQDLEFKFEIGDDEMSFGFEIGGSGIPPTPPAPPAPEVVTVLSSVVNIIPFAGYGRIVQLQTN